MIKLFKVKEKQRELAENNNGKPPVKKQSAGELRLHKGTCKAAVDQHRCEQSIILLKQVRFSRFFLTKGGTGKTLSLGNDRIMEVHGKSHYTRCIGSNPICYSEERDSIKDISELNLPKTCTMSFPNGKDDLMNFEVTIRPDEGYYTGGIFTFMFQISHIYPHDAPKVKCKTKVYHPNIDLEGNVCLNILREDWKPVLNINTVIYGLYHLFTEPNHEDPLNPDAAAVLRDNPRLFESNVRRAMSGGYVGQTFFSRCV